MRGSTRTSRIAAYAASAALAVSGTILAVSPAQAVAHDPIGEEQAASWLARQVTGGLVPGQFGGPDVGLSIDTALSLRNAGNHSGTVAAITNTIEDDGTSYLESAYEYLGKNYVNRAANATAKAMALFQTLTPARTTIGTINVQSRLESLTASSAPIDGRLTDFSTEDGVPDNQDYANTLGQAFAAFALTKAGSSRATDVVAFLLEQQCPNGGFRLSFNPDRAAVDQSCTNNASAETDATAIALQQLNQIPTTGAITAAKASARAFLLGVQKSDGSWGGGAGTEASNANSTGLAAIALGDTTASEAAARWLRAHQATDYDACDKLAGQRGAIAYDTAGLTAGRSGGIAAGDADQWRRATAQALNALAYLPLDTTPSVPVLSAPGGYLKTGTRQILTTTGVAAGDQLCLTGVGAAVQGVATTGTWGKAVTLPAGTFTRVYTVRDSFGHADTAAVKVLGRKTLTVTKSKFRVKRKRYVTAMVSGLAPAEWSRIFYKGRLVRSGKATSTGRFLVTFKVGRAKGKKAIVGYGQFTDIRRGATTIKVVR
jgi:hypothetical protein